MDGNRMAAGELSDAEVFGASKELSDAEVFGHATLNPNLQRQGSRFEGIREAASQATEMMSSRDPGIDYGTGVPDAAFRAGFSRMTNEPEKENYLNRSVGQGAWGKDSFGAYYLKPEGLAKLGITWLKEPTSIDEQTTSRYDIADVAGDLPAIAGGAGLGIAATGLGAIPGMALAGLGAMGGKAIDEVVKNLQGYQVKSTPEVAQTLLGEGASAVAGEGAARLAAPIARFALGPGASRMTPEKKALAEEAAGQGFKIRPGSVTDAPILARWEGMVRNIFGDIHAEQNKRAAQAGLTRLTPSSVMGKEAAGEAIKNSIKGHRVKFSEVMSQRYAEIDELVGGVPIVPNAPLKERAKLLLENLPKTAEGKTVGGKDSFLREILAMGDAQTVAQAQRLRTMLREASESPDMVPGVAMHEARELKKALEEAFELAKQGPNLPATKTSTEAIQKLRSTDAAYAQGIRQFDKPVITAITKDASRSGAVDADMVVDYLIKPERAVRLRHVKSLVPASEWEKVKSAHAQDLLSSVVKGTDDPLKSIFNGRTFRDTLDKYGREVLEEVHGKDWVTQAYNYANALMLAEKRTTLSGGIVAANVALHPIANLPKLVWLRGLAHVMEQPGTFKYLTEGVVLGPETKQGTAALSRVFTQAAALARDETGSAKFTVTSPATAKEKPREEKTAGNPSLWQALSSFPDRLREALAAKDMEEIGRIQDEYNQTVERGRPAGSPPPLAESLATFPARLREAR